MATTDLNPTTLNVLATEVQVPFTVDWSDVMVSGETLSVPNAVVYDVASSKLVPSAVATPIGVNGNTVQYVLLPSATLAVGHAYSVGVGVQITPNNRYLYQNLTVKVT